MFTLCKGLFQALSNFIFTKTLWGGHYYGLDLGMNGVGKGNNHELVETKRHFMLGKQRKERYKSTW